VWYNDLSPWERGAALPAIGLVWPSVGLAPLPPLAASPPSMAAQAGKLEGAGSWKAATLVAAGSMRKLQLQAAASSVSQAEFRCAHLNLCIAFFFFLCYNESIK